MDTIYDAVNSLLRYDNYIMTTHINPDGDALGSLTGLGLALFNMGKNVVMIMPHSIPAAFQFLPGARQIKKVVDHLAGFDMAIAVDCTDLNRIGEGVREVFCRTENIANIDHHISNRFFGNINVVDPKAAATGEIIADLLQKAGISIAPDIATCLYTALVSDTGSFKQQNTTAKSLRTAAFLLDRGAQHRVIQRNLYEQKSLESLHLLASGLESLSLNESGTIAWMSITRKSLKDSGASVEDTEGMINYVKSLKGVEVGILFKEATNGEINVSFRSNDYLNVNQLAAYFGGGGHERAAGCIISGEIKEVEYLVLQKTEEKLYDQYCGRAIR
ncbi:MAG: bifunctional oligoribonuclease/PAP phosphatase NrnA [Syntrophaceticus sp.]|nr:bifunctional oligoribonuclease/PAP phosphatase NrnA [Syntrophaceticus sp.]MDD3313909.1 bifunctional oligoribonuclease/PAP phosphatase NrnA [Syntrophaceticus sp.]MDD4358987.1 bifunctional oligoribonuclease/PAP phosphatase NrnA [Syntrophaceticus sp.]MDD4782213.1 bifunctional oligoribonuclease/PAP phosphatase NrnA [Syntrophaceticus sp.]